ncbi:MAG: GntR family transcriptional regulator [Coprobacillaceae bacterium]
MITRKPDGLSSQIYNDLKKKIEEFEIKPGDRISETTLASVYNVSRTPIKHSLARLENEELIFVRPQVGTFVSKIDTVHIHEFFTIRMLLEVSILDEVMSLSDTKLLDDLTANITAQRNLLKESVENEELDVARIFWKLDNAFHKLIFDAVGKGFIWKFIMSQSSQFNRYRLLTVSNNVTYLEQKVNEHEGILNYLRNPNNKDAKAIYNNHLFTTLESTTNELKEKYPDYFE